MRREGWIYALAFAAIVAVGGMIIVPRLRRGPPPPPEGQDAAGPVATPPAAAEPPIGQPLYEPVTIRIAGAGGALRGPLRPVHGAEVEVTSGARALVPTLRVRPVAATVHFGAPGHQWVAVRAADLRDGGEVELPAAAPPLIVRVRERDGRPAADVPVRVRPAPPGDVARTDAGGTVVFDHLPPGLVTLDLNSAERSGPRLRLRAGVDRDVRAVLEPPWRVHGRVVVPGGRPVPAARITAFGPAGVLGPIVHTGADGAFEWTGPATARAALRIRATGWSEHSVEVSPPALAPLRTEVGDVVLRTRGVSVDGTVESAFREPDAYVLVEPAVAAIVREYFGDGQVLDRPRRTTLGEDGRFRFHDLPADLPLRLAVRGAGVPVDLIVRGKAGEELSVVLEPPRGETLTGTLVQPDGEPAAGVTLFVSREARDGDRELPGDRLTTTGPDGGFSLRGLAGRIVYLRAYAAGRRSLLERVALPPERPLRFVLESALTDAGRRVEGRVSDEAGRPLSGVTVRAAGIVGHTDESGRFALDGVESVAPSLRLSYGYESGALPASAPDPGPFVPAASVAVVPGTPAGDLVLRGARELRFRVLDAVDEQPLAFVHVVVRGDDGRLLFDRGVATDAGRVELPPLAASSVELTVVTHGRRYVRSAVPLPGGPPLDLGDLLMPRGMRIEGRVLDEAGSPVPGARIGGYGRGWQHVGTDPGADRELLFRIAQADGDGRFVLEGFDPRAAAELAVWASGYAPTALRVALPPFSEDVRTTVQVKLVRGGYLALDLRESGGRGGPGPRIRGALVDLEYARDGSDWLDLLHAGMLGGTLGSSEEWAAASEQLLPEHRGSEDLILGPLRPGPYELWVVRPGYVRLRRRLTVVDPREKMINLTSGRETPFAGRIMRLQFEMDVER